MSLPITSLSAAVLGLFFLWLSARVITYRRANQVSLGDGGDKALQRRIRAQGNFTEYTPIALILLALAELCGVYPLLLAPCALALVAGRVLHGLALNSPTPRMRFRVFGTALTLVAIAALCVINIVASLV